MLMAVLLAGTAAIAEQEEITLEKLWLERHFMPETITMGKSMQDGLHYTLIIDGTNIDVHQYETGEFVERIFTSEGNLEDEDGNALRIDTYSFCPAEEMLLVGVNQESIYRRSRRAEYHVWDIAQEVLVPLSEGTTQRLPDFSPDGRHIAFVRQNNIYVKELDSGEEYAVTTDGEYNHIINGTTDWVYEEEFLSDQGF